MPLAQPQLDDLVASLSVLLRARAGEPLTDLVIADRARNIAAALDGAYAMWPLPEGEGTRRGIRVANGLRGGELARAEQDRLDVLLARWSYLRDCIGKTDGVDPDAETWREKRRTNRMLAEAGALRWAIEIITGVDLRQVAPAATQEAEASERR